MTSVAALAVFVAYAGVKGAYISTTTFGTFVVERNLIYLCPILFAATALAFARGIGRAWAIAGAGYSRSTSSRPLRYTSTRTRTTKHTA